MTQLQLLQGGKTRVSGANTEIADTDVPAAPKFVVGYGLVEWKRVSLDLFSAGRLTTLDANLLGAYCMAYANYKEVEEAWVLAKRDPHAGVVHGSCFKTSTGHIIQHPLLGQVNTARHEMLKLGKEFGLTPASRSAMAAQEKGENDPISRKYF